MSRSSMKASDSVLPRAHHRANGNLGKKLREAWAEVMTWF